MTADPLTARCPYCRAPAGEPCGVRGSVTGRVIRPAARPHKARTRLALALAAHADPSLDAFFPRLGPCGICSVPGLDQRHRVIDAIAANSAAASMTGEPPEDVAGEYGVPVEAVRAVVEWAAKWPAEVWL